MKKTISVFIGFFLIFIMFGCSSHSKKIAPKPPIKEIKPIAEFEAVLCEATQNCDEIWILRFDNDMVVPISSFGKIGRENAWFVGKKYRVWIPGEDEEFFEEWKAELIEFVGIPVIDQEVEKRLNRIKEVKNKEKRLRNEDL